jgi:hypothetical protein
MINRGSKKYTMWPVGKLLSPLLRVKLKTPMLAYVGPKIIDESDLCTEIMVPLNWRTSNSWGTMFFGAIAAGCDLTGGWAALRARERTNVGVLYKDMSIKFLRRVDGDLSLVCSDVPAVIEICREAALTGKRVNTTVEVRGYVRAYSDTTPVVSSSMTLSLKLIKSI